MIWYFLLGLVTGPFLLFWILMFSLVDDEDYRG